MHRGGDGDDGDNDNGKEKENNNGNVYENDCDEMNDDDDFWERCLKLIINSLRIEELFVSLQPAKLCCG